MDCTYYDLWVVCKNPLSYEEILNWRGFSFESSRQLLAHPLRTVNELLGELENGMYGIEESERILNNVINKQKGY